MLVHIRYYIDEFEFIFINIISFSIIYIKMAISRSRTIIYILLTILILLILLRLLSSNIEGLIGVNPKPKANIEEKPKSNVQPKKYTIELYQEKEEGTLAGVPTFGANAQSTEKVFNPETIFYINAISSSQPDVDNKSDIVNKIELEVEKKELEVDEKPIKTPEPEAKKEYKAAVFKVNRPETIVLHKETEKITSFIAVAPQAGGIFPKKFNFTITNPVEENKLSLDLWGTSPAIENAPSNSIIGSDNYTSFPYPPELFETKEKDGTLIDGLKIGGINIGNNALHIIGVGRIFDRKFGDIGEVQNLNNTLNVMCNNSSGITGMLFYLGKAVPV